jgi:hypothetical protein
MDELITLSSELRQNSGNYTAVMLMIQGEKTKPKTYGKHEICERFQ